MIQATTETDFTFYIQTEDNRIDKSAATSKIRHLLKFTNDMDKSVHYVYATAEVITARHTNGSAPATENDVLAPAASTKGVVKGLVTKGIMYVAEKDGTEQVQYKQHEETSSTNYIYYGQ